MKTTKFRIAVMAGLLLGMSTSCEDFYEDKIATPNNPTEVSPGLLLTTSQVATFANFGGQLARQTNILTQHIAGTSAGSQTVEIANYNITELTNVNEWEVIYADAVVNTDIIINDFGAESPHYAGMARVLKAMNLSVATDLFGDVPFAEASSGLDVEFNPAYDQQSDIYDPNNPNGLFGLLDEAIANLGEPEANNAFFPGPDDLIYGGDVNSWIALAHSLKARFHNRRSQVDGAGSATSALSSLASAISSSAENANMAFGPNGNELNQWYAYNQSRGDYIKMGEFFVDTLTDLSDPRLDFYAAPAPNGNFVGTPKDDVDSIATSNIGTYLNSIGATVPLATYAEMKFIEAEANLRAGNPQPAADAHNEAVIASVTQVTGSAPDAAFIAAHASEDAATIDLETIMTQKYIAMFGQIEAYNDYRRTGLPSTITPNANGNITTIPVRLIYPQDERLYNSSFPGTKQLSNPVWWDQ